MQIIQDAAVRVVLPNQAADQVLETVERSKLIAEDEYTKEIVVYWDYDEMVKLATYSDAASVTPMQFPSPMTRDYKWPGIYRPFSHQVTTASFLSLRPRAFCFNEAGTGKTSAAIWAADYLMNIGQVKRCFL